jgi:hypothetical protein
MQTYPVFASAAKQSRQWRGLHQRRMDCFVAFGSSQRRNVSHDHRGLV